MTTEDPKGSAVTVLSKTPRGGNSFPARSQPDHRISTRAIATTIWAKLPKREGEFTFSRAGMTEAADGRFVVELTNEDGHVAHVAFNGSDLKSLIGWRLLMGL
jgi:hypothetical protein